MNLRGIFTLLIEEENDHKGDYWQRRKDGLIVPHFSADNLVVNLGRSTAVHLLGEETAPLNKYLNYVMAGTEGHEEGDINTPVPPTLTDDGLEDPDPQLVPLYSKTYLPVEVETSLLMVFLMDKPNGNGGGTKNYTEAMLYSADGTPFSRETHKPALKDETKKLYYEWAIL